MRFIIQWALANPGKGLAILGTAHWVVLVMIDALPMPTAASSPLYAYFFRVANVLGGNASRAAASFGPAGQQAPKEG